MDQPLNVKYKVEAGKFTREQLEKEGAGGCDALLLVSIVRDGKHAHEGPLSIEYISIDGTREKSPSIPDTELFSIMGVIARDLAEKDNIPAWMKNIARRTFEEIKTHLQERAMGWLLPLKRKSP